MQSTIQQQHHLEFKIQEAKTYGWSTRLIKNELIKENIYNGFTSLNAMNECTKILSATNDLLIKMHNHNRGQQFPFNEGLVVVLSNRPRLTTDQPNVVMNWQYNNLLEDIREENDYYQERIERKKRNKELQKQAHIDKQKTIELVNKYNTLINMCDEIDLKMKPQPMDCIKSVKRHVKKIKLKKTEEKCNNLQDIDFILDEIIEENNKLLVDKETQVMIAMNDNTTQTNNQIGLEVKSPIKIEEVKVQPFEAHRIKLKALTGKILMDKIKDRRLKETYEIIINTSIKNSKNMNEFITNIITDLCLFNS
jgi:hypothetical protein